MTPPQTILIVDDEFAIADLLEDVLVDEGYCVLKAGNGRQALDRLAGGAHPDLVISDFMMPVLDGAGLITAMREDDAHHGIPVVVMSSMPEASVRERIDNLAAFIRKPFRIVAIIDLVAGILRSSVQR